MKQRYYILMAVSVICMAIGTGLLVGFVFHRSEDYTSKAGAIADATRIYFLVLFWSTTLSLLGWGKIRMVARWTLKIQLYALAVISVGIYVLTLIIPEIVEGEWWQQGLFQVSLLGGTAGFYWLGKSVSTEVACEP